MPRGIHALVIDAHSADETAALAAGLGATVVRREWTDFVDARRFALTQVRTPWVLMLDADEVLDDELGAAIASADGTVYAGYRLRRTTFFCGRALRLWEGEQLLRLFQRTRATLRAQPAAGGDAPLHERWQVDGPVAELPGRLLHYSYPDRAAYRRKFERYTAIEGGALKSSLPGFALAVTLAVPRFMRLMLLRGAVLDGWRGWYVAFWSSAYPAVARWKALRR